MAQENQVNFTVHNIYVKDVSFEAPNSPQIFNVNWKPKLDFNITMGRNDLENNLHEVIMSLTVTVTITPEGNGQDIPENTQGQTAFLVEVKQAGIFLLEGITEPTQIDYILSTAAPTIIFPYARETISSLVGKGGFPQLIIPPLNFESMYQQHLTEQQQLASTVANA